MSRGRKSKDSVDINEWQKYFNLNIGAYFRIIISNLSRNSPLTDKSGNDILINIRTVDKRIIYDVKEEEIPFDIPINWAWTKLPSICEIATGNKDVNEGDLNGVYPFFTCAQEPLKSNTFSFDDDCILLPGNGANVGHVNRYQGKFELYQRTYCLHSIHKLISVDFLHYYLRAFWKSNLGTQYGSGINYLRISNFNNFLIPIPPVEEQNLIVNFFNAFELNEIKVDQYSFCKEIESSVILLHHKQLISSEILLNSKEQLTQLENLNQAILQEAVQGKLVPQDPQDETASELLKRIKNEKAKSGKKEKPLPPIRNEEIPFEIPENWVWCRLGEIANLKSGNQYQLNSTDSGIMYVKVGDMNNSANDYEIKISSTYYAINDVNERDLIPKYSIIFPKRGGAIATNKRRVVLAEQILVDSNTMAVTPEYCIDFKYFFFWFSNIDLSKLGNDGVIPQVNNKDIDPLLFPLPPLSEQKRIVAEIEKQLAKTKQLKEHIIANQQATEQLLKALLHQAFEVKEMETV